MKKRALVLSVIALAALFFAARGLYRVFSRPQDLFATPVPQRTARPSAAPTPSPTLSPEEALLREADADFMKDRVNILLLGWDESPERNDEDSETYRGGKNGFRSDVMMLLAVNFAENTAHLISIPRDTYSPLYNVKGRWKINAAFAKGGGRDGDGFTYAVKTVEMLFGVPVTHYIGVDMEGLKHLVDALGGVDYDVDVRITLNGRVLEKGPQHLDGQQVLDYCRARKGISTDLGRNDRQQRMLMTIFSELQRANKLTAIPAIYTSCKDDVYTSLTSAQIAALAAFALRLDPETDLARSTLAGEYVSNVYNASYYVLINKKLEALVYEEFGVKIDRADKYDLSRVKRDKAAQEAEKAAEAAEDIASMLVLPALGDGSSPLTGGAQEVAQRLRYCIHTLRYAIEVGASETEIVRLRRQLDRAVQEAARTFSVDGGELSAYYGVEFE